ncbi:endonuclease/exonuclease/phosphatase family protein [bacterium]|nr:endonuclease/exonuclease/phosphatase family protein [bacterium]
MQEHWFRRLTSHLVSGAGTLVLLFYYFQFDILAPVTMIPPWLWLIAACLIFGLSYRAFSRWRLVFSLVVWSTFLILFVEEARSLIRISGSNSIERSASHSVDGLRIVTLNCHMGSYAAAMELEGYQPDVVLLQESPGMSQLPKIANALLGPESGWISCGDASILVRGKLVPIVSDQSSHFAHAVVTSPNGLEFDVVSLRLSPPVFRFDFWNAEFWNSHLETRKHHRLQLEMIVEHLNRAAKTNCWIIGGDFNLVGNDGALDAMKELSDTFFQMGSGWGNTGTNNYPLFRVDQIWTNSAFACNAHRAFATQNSDHRMVLADLVPAK